MEAGTIVGIVLAILAAVIIGCIIIFFFLNRRKKGDWLITDKAESTVAYSNGGFVGERVNVVDYTEIPFTLAEPVRPKLDVPPQKSDIPVHNGTPRDAVAGNPTVQTNSVSVDVTRENPTGVSVGGEEAFHEIDFHDSDDDYATLDSVAKIRSKKADAAEKRKSNHAEVLQMPQPTVPDQENECEYATVVPKSLRGNKDSFRDKAEFLVNVDQSSDVFHPVGKTTQDTHSEISDHELIMGYL